MGLKNTVDAILGQSLHTAYRPPEAAIANGAHNWFQLVGGPAYVKGFFIYGDAPTGAAVTWQLSICGVIAENGGAAVANLLIGEMAVWPLHGAAAGDVMVPNVANAPYPPLASEILGMSGGILISPGSAGGDIFVMTTAAGPSVGATSAFVLYYKMRPQTLIVPL